MVGVLMRPTLDEDVLPTTCLATLPALRTKRSTRRASGTHPPAVGFALRLNGEIAMQLSWIHLPGYCIQYPHHYGVSTVPLG
jgi:hypothetical protein